MAGPSRARAARGVVHGHRVDVVGRKELLALCERLPVRVCATHALESRPGRSEQRVVHAQNDLAHDTDQARA